MNYFYFLGYIGIGFEVFLASYRGMAEHTGVSVGPTVGWESGPGFIVHYIASYWLVA
jgi:hypothetical protein